MKADGIGQARERQLRLFVDGSSAGHSRRIRHRQFFKWARPLPPKSHRVKTIQLLCRETSPHDFYILDVPCSYLKAYYHLFLFPHFLSPGAAERTISPPVSGVSGTPSESGTLILHLVSSFRLSLYT